MAKAVQVEVAEAVKDILTENKFGHTFEPERSYADWDFMLDAETGTLVDIVGVLVGSELASQGDIVYDVRVDIAVRRRFSADQQSQGQIDIDEIDALCKLVEDIFTYFAEDQTNSYVADRHLVAYPTAAWREVEIAAIADREHLRKSQFTGVVRISFDVTRPE